jgi:hypothetical protein
MYNVTAKSHIGPVDYTIVLDIDEANVVSTLAKGVLYDAQRIAASKAVKALGGGKRANLVYNDEAREAVESALRKVFGESAEVECSEHVKGATVTKKFAQARDLLTEKVASGADIGEIAERAGFDGDIHDEDGDYTTEFLVAIDNRIKALAKSL